MLILGIDTCCMAATAAVTDDNRLIAQTVINHKKTHSQKMMPQIEGMLDLAEIDIKEIDGFAVAVGPGSFTGVRIGVATIKALAQANNKPCVAISTLEGLANNNALFNGIVCPILDARREQVYNSLFKDGLRLCDDRALGIIELLDELKNYEDKILFCGDGTLVFKDIIKETLGNKAVFAQRMQNLNLGASIAELGYNAIKNGDYISYNDLIPSYIRLSQAERERLESTKNL